MGSGAATANADGTVQSERDRLAEIGRRLQADLIAAEQAEAVRLRDAGRIGEATLREVQRELDVERVQVGRV